MQTALVVHRVGPDPSSNLGAVLDMAEEAADRGATLLLFSETALTGFINNDDPTHDYPLAQEIPGPATAALGAFCRRRRVWLAIGLLEHDDGRLYDSAILLGDDGEIHLRYRRNQPNWHGRNADPCIYRQGALMSKVETPLGSVAFLICGDLFDDEVVARFRELDADWLLFPFARCFSPDAPTEDAWNREEIPLYLDRVRLSGSDALMVNHIADASLADGDYFGGAYFVSADGELLGSLPLHREGFLFVDLGNRQSAGSLVMPSSGRYLFAP